MKELPLYPIKFHPVYKEKIWGGNKLKTQLNKQNAPEKCGESWEISAVPGSVSVVKNGFLEGNSLQDILEIYMGDLVGPDIFELYGENFPLLIKFIDANDDLSVQVHPDDETAAKKHQSFGKTEAWYIIDAEKDSRLISGFNKALGKSEFVSRMNNNDILPVLNRVPVKADDLFFIPAGRVHATGKGILFAEIQQNSDVTYRIYDWDRMGVDGKPRQLHVQEALEVIDFSEVKQAETPYESTINAPSRMLRTDYFIMNMIHIDKKITKSYVDCQSFVVYMCVDGKAEIRSDNTSETIEKGETILLPYELMEIQIIPDKEVKLIEVYIELE